MKTHKSAYILANQLMGVASCMIAYNHWSDICVRPSKQEVAEEPYFYVQIKHEGKLFVDLKLQIRTSGLKNCTILPRKFYPLYSTHSSMYFSAFSLQLFQPDLLGSMTCF